MKKIALIVLCLLFFSVNAQTVTYLENKKFGLIDDTNNTKITEAKYSKLIRLKDSAYLFMYKNKFGIIDNQGNIIVEPVFNSAERLAGRFAKLGKGGKYCVYDEKGNLILGLEYSSISLLYGQMFLVQKNYKYGLVSYNGDIILAPIADDIYMPKSNIIRISYENEWYEIENVKQDILTLPMDMDDINKQGLKVTALIQKPIAATGYGLVSFSDYFIKLFSSISPSYEQTIDELILGHGADTANILIKSTWLIKFPYVYGKNYINNLKAPNNGPLSDVRANLKKQIGN